MEANEKNGGINPDKVIADSRTIRRPQVVVERVQIQPIGEPEPSIDNAPTTELPMEWEPVSAQVTPAVAATLEHPKPMASTPEPPPKRQEHRESSGRRRGLPSYRDVFVSRNEIKHRQCVYISHEVHSLVSGLVRALVDEGSEITVGGYIDKVLYEHLQAYKDEINELYRNRRPELLK